MLLHANFKTLLVGIARGHLDKVCLKKSAEKANFVESQDDHEVEDEEYTMFSLRGERCDPVTQEVLINGVRIDMEVDTGASASIISEDTYREIAAHSAMEPLQESTLKLTTYTGESISLAGSTSVAVRYSALQVGCPCAKLKWH